MGALSRQFPFSAHRRRDPGGGERLPARLARILARMLDAPVRMTDQAGSWALPPDGHLEGFHRDPGRASRLAHGPADDLAGVRGARTAARRERGPWPRWGRASPVNQPSPVRTQSLPPRRRGRYRGQIPEPDLVGPRRLEAAPDPVGSDGVPMPALGGAHAARQGRQAPQARPARSGRATRWRPTRRPRVRRTAWTRGAPELPPLSAWARRTSSRSARLARLLALSGRERHARVAADGHPQHAAHDGDRPDVPVLIPEAQTSSGGRVPRTSAAMRPMSRSIEGRASSRLSRAVSAARSAGDGPDEAAVEDRRASPIPGSPCF